MKSNEHYQLHWFPRSLYLKEIIFRRISAKRCLAGIFLICIASFFMWSNPTMQTRNDQHGLNSSFNGSSKINYKLYKLLIASSISTIDMAAYVHSMRSYLGTGVKFALNCHDGNRSREHLEVYMHDYGIGDLVIFISAQPGAKILFWKNYLTPSLVSSFDIIWLLDSDVFFDLNHFPLNHFLHIAMSAQALIFQPAIIGPAGRDELKFNPNSHNSVAKANCYVEITAAFILSNIWQKIHNEGLTRIDNQVLLISSWGIDNWWCDFAASQQLKTVTLSNTSHSVVPACLLVNSIPIVHLDTRSMPRNISGSPESRIIGTGHWISLSNTMNVTNKCERLDELLQQQKKILFYMRGNKLVHVPLDSGNLGQNSKFKIKEELSDWKENAAKIYVRNRHQNVRMVQQLNAKWKNKILIGNKSSWELFQKLKNVIDPTDNTLRNMTQWGHALQVYAAMKFDNVTSSKALFLALMHDIGKLLFIFGEDPANIMCSTIVLELDQQRKGLDQAVIIWNHDEFGFQKLQNYIPRDMAWVIRYHSLSALLTGELDRFLTPEEFTWFPLLRLLWKYDHFSKSAVHVPQVDLNEVRATLETFLPRTILF